jgi:polyphosphate kinase 2 (PPK2 family)
LVRNGTLVVKFFLHLSKDEQRSRLTERLDAPAKNWKLAASDMHERAYWRSYQHAYGELLTRTSTEWAPWYIIPADHKWFSRVAVADVILSRLRALDLAYPVLSGDARARLRAGLAEATAATA